MTYGFILTIIGRRESERLDTLATPADAIKPEERPITILDCPKCKPKKVIQFLSSSDDSRASAQMFVSQDTMGKPAEMFILGFTSEEAAMTWAENRKSKLIGKEIFLDVAPSEPRA